MQNLGTLGNTQTIRENSTRGEEVVKIELDKIIVREGFNVRQDYGDIEGLALSLRENGQTVAGRVDVLEDGTFVLTDGHRRFKALQLLSKDYPEVTFKAIVNGKKTTDEQRILQMFTTQDNKPLTPHEVAELIQRLVNLGYKPKLVAEKIGKTQAYVSQMLDYASDSQHIKAEVVKGNITVGAANELRAKMPDVEQREKAVKEAVDKKKDNKKLSAKDVLDTAGVDKKLEKAGVIVSHLEAQGYLADVSREEVVNFIKGLL